MCQQSDGLFHFGKHLSYFFFKSGKKETTDMITMTEANRQTPVYVNFSATKPPTTAAVTLANAVVALYIPMAVPWETGVNSLARAVPATISGDHATGIMIKKTGTRIV